MSLARGFFGGGGGGGLAVVGALTRGKVAAQAREFASEALFGLLFLVLASFRRALSRLEILAKLSSLRILLLGPRAARRARLGEVLQRRARLGVEQDVVRLLELVELALRLLSFARGALVGVQHQRLFAVRLLDDSLR